MYLGEIIKTYRSNKSLSMDVFASMAGLSKGYISMLEKNINPKTNDKIAPSLETFKKVADAMNISVDDLIKMVDGSQKVTLRGDESSSQIQSSPPKGVRINVYGSVPAGIPIEAIEDVIEWEEIPVEWTTGGQEYIALKVKGESMYPKYLDGDIVIIRLQPNCENGQDCVVYVNGQDATLKKITKMQDGLILQPLNPNFEPRFYDYNDELNPVKILGVVVQIRRNI